MVRNRHGSLPIIAFLLVLIIATLLCRPAHGAGRRVAVLISADQEPYLKAADGVEEFLTGQGVGEVRRFPLAGDQGEAEQATVRIATEGTDLVVALGSIALDAASRNIQGTPIVAGIVMDIRREGNVTGVQLEIPFDVQLDWMKRFLPAAGTVGIVYNPQENQERVENLERIAAGRGIKIESRTVSAPNGLLPALESLGNRIDVLLGIPDRVCLTSQTAQQVLLFSFRNRIPFIGLSAAWVKAGALYALDRDYRDIGAQCGEMALRLLNGGKIADVHPAFPRKVLYALNGKAVEQMKLKLPSALVEGAAKSY